MRYLGITATSVPAESLFKGRRGSEPKTKQTQGEDLKYAIVPSQQPVNEGTIVSMLDAVIYMFSIFIFIVVFNVFIIVLFFFFFRVRNTIFTYFE